MYVIRDKEAGNVICRVETKEEAIDKILEFELDDVFNNIYEPDFYEFIEEGE